MKLLNHFKLNDYVYKISSIKIALIFSKMTRIMVVREVATFY